MDSVAECGTEPGDRGIDVGALVVDPAHDDGARHPGGGTLVPDGARREVDLLGGGHDEEGGVGGAQSRTQLADEVDVPRCVDQVDLHPVVDQRGDRQTDGAVLAYGRRIVVADGRAGVDRTGA